MMQVSWSLYDIVVRTFKSKTWKAGDQYALENEWHDFLIGQEVFVETVSGRANRAGPSGIAESVIDVMILLENGGATLDKSELDKYIACPDPMNPTPDGFCSILMFPRELAERILILGYLPCPMVSQAL